jgi:hypothetical protein
MDVFFDWDFVDRREIWRSGQEVQEIQDRRWA